jgi:PAS domain S-box-containing protein
MILDVRTIAALLGQGDHAAHIYDDPADQRAVAAAFVHDGLTRNERCLLIGSIHEADTLIEDLRAAGADAAAALASGALRLVEPGELYGAAERRPESVIPAWSALLEEATDEGYDGLRVVTVASVDFVETMGAVDLAVLENGINYFICPGRRMTVLCQYGRRRFAATLIESVLQTHPRVIVGREPLQNLYYRAPDLVHGDAERAAAGRIEWMLRHLRGATASPIAGETMNGGHALRPRDPGSLGPTVENWSDATCVVADVRVPFASRSTERAFGYPPQSVAGRPTSELLHTEERQSRAEHRRRTAQHAAIAALGQRALEGATIVELVDQAARAITEALEVEYGAVGELIGRGDRLLMTAGCGWRSGLVGQHTVPVGMSSPAGLAMHTTGPVIVHELAYDRRFELPRMLLDHGIRSAVTIVVPGMQRPFGVLGAYTTCVRDFTAADIDFLQGLAHTLAAAVARREAEAELLTSRSHLASVIESAMDAIIGIDEDERIVVFNHAAETIFRCTATEAVGQGIGRFLPGKRIGTDGEDADAAVAKNGSAPSRPGRRTAIRADGEVFPIEATISHADTQPSLTTVFLRDVSERQRLEEQLRQAAKMEAVGRLAGGVAHDFNNLLVAITGYSDMLLCDLPPESPCRLDAQEIRQAADRAAALTRQLLAFSRRQVLKPERVELNDTLHGLERLLARIIGEDIVLSLDLDPTVWPVEADKGQLEQVIINLAVNARDAMPNGGRLSISTRNVLIDQRYAQRYLDAAGGEYAALTVTDDGSGIAEEDLTQIFEPFFTTKATGKGTGLGLATVYGIVKQSGGHIEVHSERGFGTTFSIYLPRNIGAAKVEVEAAQNVATATAGKVETVVVVEDDPSVLAATARMLERWGFRVFAVPDADGAMALCSGEDGSDVSLVLSDVVMPNMGGLELTARLAETRPDLRVLLMSGYSDENLDPAALEASGLHMIHKPFAATQLVARVRAALDARPT